MRPHVNQHHNTQDRSQTAVGPLENSVEPSGSGRVCNCSVILLTSSSPATRAKHGAELGRYRLAGQYSGRPVYRHESRGFYLYYQPESGGNWLVNTQPGLLYGGIQNSKASNGVNHNPC